MKKKVLLDLVKIKNLYSGLGQVSLNMAVHFSQIEDNELEFTFLLPSEAASSFKNTAIEKVNFLRRYIPFLSLKYDLWHAIHQDSNFKFNKEKNVLTIHDLNFLGEKSPQKQAKRLKRLQKKVDRADAVVFISDYSRSIAEKHLHFHSHQVLKRIYNGVHVSNKMVNKTSFLLPEKPFLFALGVVQEKKNFHVLLDMMKLLPEYSLIISGDDDSDYARNIRNRIVKEKLSERVLLTGRIEDAEKNFLFQHCEAFVFPSKFEGFGLPIVEAMHFGKPVFTSNWSSLTEAGSDKAYYWEKFEPQYMKKVLLEGINDFHHKNRSMEMKKYAQQYSWNENVRQYIELYKEILL